MAKAPLVFDDKPYLEQLRQREVFVHHIHWDGSLPADALFAFYQRRGKPLLLPERDVHGTHLIYASEAQREIDSEEKLREFQMGLLTKYDITDVFAVPIGAMQTEQDLKEMAVAHCRYLQSQNIPYAETRFAPYYHMQEGLSMDRVIGYTLEGFAQGREETGVIVQPIVSINREIDGATSQDIVKAALRFAGKGIVGIDLVCYEVGNPPEKHADAFALTFDSPLQRAVHAGEMCTEEENLKNMYTAITQLRAHAIGHGIPLHKRKHKNHDLVELMVERSIRLESNPISNYYFFIDDIQDLHLDALVDAGVLVTINPDDPAMWPNGDLVHNLYVVGKLYGDAFVDTVIDNSIRAAWA